MAPFCAAESFAGSIVAIAVPMHLFSAAEGEVLVVISRMPLSRDVASVILKIRNEKTRLEEK